MYQLSCQKCLSVASASVYDVEHAKTVQTRVRSWKSTENSKSYAPKKKFWYLLKDRTLSYGDTSTSTILLMGHD